MVQTNCFQTELTDIVFSAPFAEMDVFIIFIIATKIPNKVLPTSW